MAITVLAMLLVIVASVLAGALDDWTGVPWVLAAAYLGLLLFSIASGDVTAAAIAAITAVGVEVVLLPSFLSIATLRRRWATRAIRSTFAVHGFHLLGFDVSITGVAVVGAIGLAVARPVVRTSGVDVAVDVLAFSGLLACLGVRPARLAVGLIFLPMAATLLVERIGTSLPRADVMLAMIAQLTLAVVLAHLRTVEEARSPERRIASDSERSTEPLVQPTGPPRSAEETGS